MGLIVFDLTTRETTVGAALRGRPPAKLEHTPKRVATEGHPYSYALTI